MRAPLNALMVQGTTSDAGKSVLVAGLCRVLARKGIKVVPFKPQNMALNSAVTKDGGEIGRAQAKGFVINRFRGDIALLQSGLDWLEEKTGKPVIGVLPYLHGFNLEAEDAITSAQESDGEAKLKVAVPVFKRISNHTDFDALRLNPSIDLRYVGKGERLNNADLIILPGTKSVRADLDYLKQQGWDKDIQRHLRLGGNVMGICGGYQMLGNMIHDPDGVEGEPGSSEGLGYLDVETMLTQQKTLTNVFGTLNLNGKSAPVKGYEIHVDRTDVNEMALPVQLESGSLDGAINPDNSIFGTYLHGVLDNSDALSLSCEWAGANEVAAINHEQLKELGINRIADAIEEHLNLDLLWPELKPASQDIKRTTD